MTACTAIIECRHKIAFVSVLPIEKLLPFFPLCAFHFTLCSHLYFDLFCYQFYFRFSFRAEYWLLPPTDDCNLYSWGPLDPPTGKKNLQAVNELPSMPSVKGVYKLTEAFVRVLLRSLTLSSSCHHFLSSLSCPPPHHALPPALQFSPPTCLLHAPVADELAGAALSGFGSEQHSLSVRFMFRISHLMRTK